MVDALSDLCYTISTFVLFSSCELWSLEFRPWHYCETTCDRLTDTCMLQHKSTIGNMALYFAIWTMFKLLRGSRVKQQYRSCPSACLSQSLCLSLSRTRGLLSRKKNVEKKQNWCERFPRQQLPVCQFSVQKVKDQAYAYRMYIRQKTQRKWRKSRKHGLRKHGLT